MAARRRATIGSRSGPARSVGPFVRRQRRASPRRPRAVAEARKVACRASAPAGVHKSPSRSTVEVESPRRRSAACRRRRAPAGGEVGEAASCTGRWPRSPAQHVLARSRRRSASTVAVGRCEPVGLLSRHHDVLVRWNSPVGGWHRKRSATSAGRPPGHQVDQAEEAVDPSRCGARPSKSGEVGSTRPRSEARRRVERASPERTGAGQNADPASSAGAPAAPQRRRRDDGGRAAHAPATGEVAPVEGLDLTLPVARPSDDGVVAEARGGRPRADSWEPGPAARPAVASTASRNRCSAARVQENVASTPAPADRVPHPHDRGSSLRRRRRGGELGALVRSAL